MAGQRPDMWAPPPMYPLAAVTPYPANVYHYEPVDQYAVQKGTFRNMDPAMQQQHHIEVQSLLRYSPADPYRERLYCKQPHYQQQRPSDQERIAHSPTYPRNRAPLPSLSLYDDREPRVPPRSREGLPLWPAHMRPMQDLHEEAASSSSRGSINILKPAATNSATATPDRAISGYSDPGPWQTPCSPHEGSLATAEAAEPLRRRSEPVAASVWPSKAVSIKKAAVTYPCPHPGCTYQAKEMGTLKTHLNFIHSKNIIWIACKEAYCE